MAFYQLSFIKLLRFNFIGAIIILIIFFFSNDISNLNRQVNEVNLITTLPKDVGIKKIDVGQGEDIWILDDNGVVMYKFIFLKSLGIVKYDQCFVFYLFIYLWFTIVLSLEHNSKRDRYYCPECN